MHGDWLADSSADSKHGIQWDAHHQLVLCSHVRRQPLVVVVARVPLHLHLLQSQQAWSPAPEEMPRALVIVVDVFSARRRLRQQP